MTRRESLAIAAGALVASSYADLRIARAAQPPPTLDPILRSKQPWFNGRPTAADLARRVVVVHVFTFACVNCRNVTPNLRTLHATRSADVSIVGIHTPELDSERDPANVARALPELGIVWPVVLDPRNVLWDAYGVGAWPTQFVFDRRGTLAATVVGDSQDATLDAAIDRAARTYPSSERGARSS